MEENEAEGLCHEVSFQPVSEGHYLSLASYELRQAICTTSELDKYARQLLNAPGLHRLLVLQDINIQLILLTAYRTLQPAQF